MATRTSKRKSSSTSDQRSKKVRENDDEAVVDDEACRWGDIGTPQPNGSVGHDIVHLTEGSSTMTIRIGDVIFLRSNDSDDANPEMPPDEAFIARIERMWEDLPKKRAKAGRMMMQARWYFKKADIEKLQGGDFTGPISREALVSCMTSRDLVLSNQYDDNEILTIMGKCTVIKRRPSSEPVPPLPPRTFVSSYSISFGTESAQGTAVLTAYDGDNDEWPTPGRDEDTMDAEEEGSMFSSDAGGRSETIHGREAVATAEESSSSSSSDDDDDSSSASSLDGERAPETEGSTTKGNIMIGPEHQVSIPPFIRGQTIKSRNPTLVWKPAAIPQAIVDDYLKDAAVILVGYMEENGLMPDEPYAPLPSARLEAMIEAEHIGEPHTLSHVSTGSSLSKASKLTRECKVDALLETLYKMHYNPEEALKAVAASPLDYVTVWTRKEKDMFNSGFRRYSGSLPMISKALASSKSFKDVVDYHYRFKIPEQFRRYQEKKREQAVRMMECLEQRRSFDAPIQSQDEMAAESRKPGAPKKSDEWHKTSISNVTGAIDERRVQARDLFLQVQIELGTEQMVRLASAVKSLKDGSIEDLQETFFEVLREQPVLLERFMAFLPKRFRSGSRSDVHGY